jgi:ATP-dependent DNA helicase
MEFEKFTPSVPVSTSCSFYSPLTAQVLMYHGSPEQRAELRATRLQPPVAAGVGNARKGRRSTAGMGIGQNTTTTFPVVITTFEMCMKDRQFLSGYMWKFIVVDEGHRLKNLDCK